MPSGYTCSQCGTYVGTYQVHTCQGGNLPYFPKVAPPEKVALSSSAEVAVLARIAYALERLVMIFEKAEEKPNEH